MTLDYKIISKASSDITLALIEEHIKKDLTSVNTYIEDSFLTNTYSLSLYYGIALTGYVNEERIVFVPSTTNTGDVLINVLGLGDKKLFLSDGTSQIPASYLTPSTNYYCEYDSALDGGSGAYKLSTETSNEQESQYVISLLNSSIELAEKYTKLVLTTTVFEIDFIDDCLGIIELRRSPYVSLNTITVDGSSYALSNVEVDNTKYPYATVDFDSLTVETANINFTAGYSTTPSGITTAILNLIGFMYENRGDCSLASIPSYISCMLNKYRLMEV